MKIKVIYSLLCFLFIGNIMAQQTPAAKQTQDYTIEGATAHLGNGKVIENSLKKGKEKLGKFHGMDWTIATP